MLVLKIKPCMSKYKLFTVKLRMAHYNSYSFFGIRFPWITVLIVGLIQVRGLLAAFISSKTIPFGFR